MLGTSDVVSIVFLSTVAFTLVGVTKLISDGHTRRRMIDDRVPAKETQELLDIVGSTKADIVVSRGAG